MATYTTTTTTSPPLSHSPDFLSQSHSASTSSPPIRQQSSPLDATTPTSPTQRSPRTPRTSSFNLSFFRSQSKSPARSATINNPMPPTADLGTTHSPIQQSRPHPNPPIPPPSPSRSFSDSHSPTAVRFSTSPPTSPSQGRSSLPHPTSTTPGNGREKRHSRGHENVATINHCGRHANDWLFNGFSVRETAGRVVHRVGSGGEKEKEKGKRRDTVAGYGRERSH